MIKNLRFYSLVGALATAYSLMPNRAVAGVQVVNLGNVDMTDEAAIKNACKNAISCSENDGNRICSNREVLPVSCPTSSQGNLYAFIEYDGDNNDYPTCEDMIRVHIVPNCTGCSSSQQETIDKGGICYAGYLGLLTAGTSGRAMYDLMSANGDCNDVDTLYLNVCVTCQSADTTCESYNSANHTRKCTTTTANICNTPITTSTATTYSCENGYQCSTNCSNTSSSMRCVKASSSCRCRDHDGGSGAYCDSNCNVIGCKPGLYFSGEETCVTCQPGTYQPVDNNTESDGESCLECPTKTDASGQEVAATTSGWGARSKMYCYLPSGSTLYNGTNGKYKYANACSWDGHTGIYTVPSYGS